MNNQLINNTLSSIKDSIVAGSYSDAAEALRSFQIENYTQRLQEETQGANRIEVKAFLRGELFNLKRIGE